jgi:hypothetical protein
MKVGLVVVTVLFVVFGLPIVRRMYQEGVFGDIKRRLTATRKSKPKRR